MKQTLNIILMPLRIVVALTVYAPIILIISGVAKACEWLEEELSNFANKWERMAREWIFLTNFNMLDQTAELARENRILKEQVRLLSPTPTGEENE